MFVERSQIAGEGELGVNRKVFVGLMRDLVEKTNQTAEVADRISIPRKADLKAAFVLADEDGNGTVDEEEFLHLFELVLAGKVKGLGSAGIAFYRAPTQHMQWGGHDFHPDTDWQVRAAPLFGASFCAGASSSAPHLAHRCWRLSLPVSRLPRRRRTSSSTCFSRVAPFAGRGSLGNRWSTGRRRRATRGFSPASCASPCSGSCACSTAAASPPRPCSMPSSPNRCGSV